MTEAFLLFKFVYTSASGSGLDAQTNNANDSDGGTWNVLNMGGSVVIKLIYTDGTVIYSPISRDNGYYYFGNKNIPKDPVAIVINSKRNFYPYQTIKKNAPLYRKPLAYP